MSGTPFLNHDTISEILSHLPQPACASLMRTCRFFYHEAGRFIAQDGVNIHNSEKIASFILFISGEDQLRCLCIRKLRIEHCDDEAENALRQLSLCLHRLTSLTSLAVSGDVLFKISPPIAIAVAQLTSLLHLEISGVGHLSCFILRTFQSMQLRSIRLSWLGYDEDMDTHDVAKIEYHPVALLSKWTSTLESVSCSAWFTSVDLPVFPHVYPKMRKLLIDWDDFPLVAPYIRAYPNLKWIDFSAGGVVSWEGEKRMIRAHHKLNVRSQSTADTRWQELEGVDGRLIDFYILGLVCPISRVNIQSGARSEDDLEMLTEVLIHARPKELKIEGDSAQILLANNSFSELLRTTAAGSRLENLVLFIDLSEYDRMVNIATALERLGAALRMCPLRRLRLCVRSSMLDPTTLPLRARSGGKMAQTTDDPPPPSMPLNLAERSLQAFDIAAYSRELEGAITSLTDAVFVIAGLRSGKLLSYIPPRTDVDLSKEGKFNWEL